MQAAVTFEDSQDQYLAFLSTLEDLPPGWVRIPISIQLMLSEEILRQARQHAARTNGPHRPSRLPEMWSAYGPGPASGHGRPHQRDWQDFDSFLDFLDDPSSSPVGRPEAVAVDAVSDAALRIAFDEAMLDRAVGGSFREAVARALAEDEARRAAGGPTTPAVPPPVGISSAALPKAGGLTEQAVDERSISGRARRDADEAVAHDVAAIQRGMAESRPSLHDAGNIQLAEGEEGSAKDDAVRLDGELDQARQEFASLQYRDAYKALEKIDPTNRQLGPFLRPREWTPTDKDVADIQEALAKAREEAARAAEANACFSSELGEPAAANSADYMRYTDFLRRNMGKPHVVDGDLADIIDEQFRDNAKVGNGSTAAAVREENSFGKPVGGRWHSIKAADAIISLKNWLRTHPFACPGDRAAAENVLRDLENAMRNK